MQLQRTLYASEQTTVNSDGASPLLLKLKSSNVSDEKIVDLLKTIRDEHLFTGDALISFDRLAKKLISVYSPNDQSGDAVLKLLSRLILKCVRPALLNEKKEERALQLFELDEQIQEIMQEYLAKDENVEKYIETARKYLKNKKIIPLKQKSDNHAHSEKLASLIFQMENSKTLSPDEELHLSKWKAEIPLEIFDQLDTNEQKQQGSILLCLLLMDVIEPALRKSTQGKSRLLLTNFENELKTLITAKLPTGITFENFLKLCKGFAVEKKAFAEKVQLIEKLFNDAVKILYDNANATDAKLIEYFNNVKAELLKLTTKRVLTANQANDTIAFLTSKVDLLIQALIKDTNELDVLADHLENYQNTFHQMVQDCQALFKGFKI
jgi:hypothetical protein